MKRQLTLVLCACAFWLACSRELPTEVEGTGKIIVDEFKVDIIYDATPGFLYPMMRHEVNFVGHLNVPGVIHEYSYHSGDVGVAFFIDYIGPSQPREKFPFKYQLWHAKLQPPGRQAGYEFQAHASNASPFVVKATSTVVRRTDGPRPELGSQQLTGPAVLHENPLFSQDGQWLYMRGLEVGGRRLLERISATGGTAEVLLESQDNFDGMALIEDDTRLVFILSKPHTPSRLVRLDLRSGTIDTITVDGALWGRALIPIPGTAQLVTVSDPNSAVNYAANLVLVDMNRKTVETLVEVGSSVDIPHYGLRPHTREISYSQAIAPDHYKILLLNLDTRTTTTFVSDLAAYHFA